MAAIKEIGHVVQQYAVAPDYFLMAIKAPEIAKRAKPGQFVHVKVSPGLEPLLRRPISLHSIDSEMGEIELLYYVKGQGTRLLSQLQADAKIDLMGPLGNGFDLEMAPEGAIVVGGGMGMAPVLPLVESLQAGGIPCTVILGARCPELLDLAEKFQGLRTKILVETYSPLKISMLDLLEEELKLNPVPVYVCGPHGLMERVADLAKTYGVKGQASLEERMGCGVGACLSCVCKVKVADGAGFTYKKSCTDGPVFNMEEVYWGE